MKLPNLGHDTEYVLKSGDIPLSSDSNHTVSISGDDAVVKVKMVKSGRYYLTGARAIINNIVY